MNQDDFETAVRKTCQGLREQGAQEVLLISVGELLHYADYFIVCNGLSRPHLKALTRFIDELASELKIRIKHVEGLEGMRWIIFDMGGLIVHLFSQEARDFYGLEELWSDAPQEAFTSLSFQSPPD